MSLYALKRTQVPVATPLELREVKTFLRIEHDDEDELIGSLIYAAADRLQRHAGISIMEQHWQATYSNEVSYAIALPRYPIRDITSITLMDICYVKRVMPSSMYYLENDTLYFTTSPYAFMIYVQYIAGMGARTADISDDIKTVLREIVGHMYENRGTVSQDFMLQYDYMKIRRVA